MDVTDYVIINPANKMPNLTQFTVCFWIKSTASGGGTPFSYAVPQADNEILISRYGRNVVINNDKSSR